MASKVPVTLSSLVDCRLPDLLYGWDRVENRSSDRQMIAYRSIPDSGLMVVVKVWKMKYHPTCIWDCFIQPDGYPSFQNLIGSGRSLSMDLSLYDPCFKLDLRIEESLELLFDSSNSREMYMIGPQGECLPFASVFSHADLSAYKNRSYILISKLMRKDSSKLNYTYHSRFDPMSMSMKYEPPAWIPEHIDLQEAAKRSSSP